MSEGGIGGMVQMVTVAFLSVLVVIIIGIFQVNSFQSAARFIVNVAQRGGSQVATLVTAATSQAQVIFEGAFNTLNGIVSEVVAATQSGLTLVLNTVVAVGGALLSAITDGAAALTELIIEFGQNLATAITNFFSPIRDILLMVGEVIIDVLNATQATFAPMIAVINGINLLVCCITFALHNFPGLDFIPVVTPCADQTCNCIGGCPTLF